MGNKALIAMSGGVDSSVAAYLTKESSAECAGVTLKLFDHGDIVPDSEKVCCTEEDASDAAEVCRKIGIPFYVFNFKDCFRETVIEKFIGAYEAGCTPNPCIECNRSVKFGKLLTRARELGFDCVVTGHYARVEYSVERGRWLLRKAEDLSKDQSYVLYCLTQEQLASVRFPLGSLTKDEVRGIAGRLGFSNASKHDSQDICFVPDGKYAEFIKSYTGRDYPFGEFVDESGAVLGEHKGIIRYTVGQRRGLGLALPSPLYVKKKDVANNRVILSDNSGLFSRELIADELNLIISETLDAPVRVKARIRYNQPEQPATVFPLGGGTVRVMFDEPQRAVSPGQAVVFYDGDIVAGGATIL